MLATAFDVSQREVAEIKACVDCNAFSLTSLVLGLDYGAALYRRAAAFNHSCDPNCMSLRMGGNMAIFAARDIARGEELRHSYLPAQLLMRPKRMRGSLLHFDCVCKRCNTETPEATASLADLSFPPKHAATENGKFVTEFKVATVGEDHAETLVLGDAILRKLCPLLLERPLAALEVLDPYLTAHWNMSLMSEEGRQGPWAEHAAAAAALWRTSILKLKQLSRDGAIRLPTAALQQLFLTSGVVWWLLEGGTREATVSVLLRSLDGLAALYGNTLDCLREDLAFVDPGFALKSGLASPGLGAVITAAAMHIQARKDLATMSMDGLYHNTCKWCSRMEEVEGSFQRCSRCKRVKYCGKEHQAMAWKSCHKRLCRISHPDETAE
eukprot:m.115973 g.115973  ORF g.115973 m.115973 type:complete len:383 (-) comp16362_c0_seq3:138-1286(-)